MGCKTFGGDGVACFRVLKSISQARSLLTHKHMIYFWRIKQPKPLIKLNLAFFEEFFSGGGIYCHSNFYCYANFSIVFEPNFGGAKVSEGGKLLEGGTPASPRERKPVSQRYLMSPSMLTNGSNTNHDLFSDHPKANFATGRTTIDERYEITVQSITYQMEAIILYSFGNYSILIVNSDITIWHENFNWAIHHWLASCNHMFLIRSPLCNCKIKLWIAPCKFDMRCVIRNAQ